MDMRRRRREPPLSPLLGQHFNPQGGSRALFQVIREIHQANFDLDPREVEKVVQEATDLARTDRKRGGGEE